MEKRLTKYERARIIGTRALQISMNAPVYVPVTDSFDSIEIAEKELLANKIPLIIRRYYTNGTFYDVSVQSLHGIDDLEAREGIKTARDKKK